MFSISEAGFIKLVDLKNNSTRTLVAEDDIRNVIFYACLIIVRLVTSGVSGAWRKAVRVKVETLSKHEIYSRSSRPQKGAYINLVVRHPPRLG